RPTIATSVSEDYAHSRFPHIMEILSSSKGNVRGAETRFAFSRQHLFMSGVLGMEFAITFKGDISPKRTVALCKQAEVAGFSYAWFFDSHVLWRECYATMAMCMEHTDTMRFGPCVTNPGVREWSVAASLFATLAQQSGGRIDMGLG